MIPIAAHQTKTFILIKVFIIMTRTEIEEKVRNFLIEDLEIEEENIFPDARLKEDMGIDSLDYVDIVVIVFHRRWPLSRRFPSSTTISSQK